MNDKAWWGPSALLSVALVGMIGFLWYEAVNKYSPHPGQLNSQAAIDDYLSRRPSGPDRVLIPTGVFVQSLHFVTASDVNITGYIWQKYSDATPEDISFGFTLPEQVFSSDTVVTEAYRRPEGDGVVIGWYFDATVRQPFDYSRYPLDRHEVWLRMWHKDFDRNIVLVPDLEAYNSMHEGNTFGVDFEIVPGGWHIEETLFEYKDGDYDTDFGIANYVGQSDFPELYYTIVVSRGFVDAFVINLVPLMIVAGLLFSILMISTADTQRAELLGFNTATVIGTASALFFVVLLAHIQLREEFSGEGVVYLEQFYFTIYFAILAVTVNEYFFTTRQSGGMFALLHYRDNLIAKVTFWPAILAVLTLVTLGYFADDAQRLE